MGPWIGPIGIVFGLPAVCYLMHLGCNASSGCLALYPSITLPKIDLESYTWYTQEAFLVFLTYFGLQVRHQPPFNPLPSVVISQQFSGLTKEELDPN